MGFLDKAKGAFKDLEGQLDKVQQTVKETGLNTAETRQLAGFQKKVSILNKGAAKLPSDTKPAASEAAESSTAPGTATPASSFVRKKSSVKLPLAIRKEVRDDWEAKLDELEASLSKLLGVPWNIDIDAGEMYQLALETDDMGRRAKENPGAVLTDYVLATTENIKQYLEKFGDDGKQELNTVVSAHTISMSEASDADSLSSASGCAVKEGSLRIIFQKKMFGTNITKATDMNVLPKAINSAGASSGGAAQSTLDFDARTGIKNNYEPGISATKAKLELILGVDGLILNPNFEANYTKLLSEVGKTDLPRDWQKSLGRNAISYFEALAVTLEKEGFGKDEMLQEGLADVTEKKEIKFEVVDTLEKGTYHETVPVDGVLCIRTTPKYYTSNIGQTGNGLMALL